jgi:hypothetical protein
LSSWIQSLPAGTSSTSVASCGVNGLGNAAFFAPGTAGAGESAAFFARADFAAGFFAASAPLDLDGLPWRVMASAAGARESQLASLSAAISSIVRPVSTLVMNSSVTIPSDSARATSSSSLNSSHCSFWPSSPRRERTRCHPPDSRSPCR